MQIVRCWERGPESDELPSDEPRRHALSTAHRELTLLYFADIRFPLERANGIQTMETCHALAVRGHRVTLVVRPDTAVPARDPFEYTVCRAQVNLTIESAPVSGPASRAARGVSRVCHRACARRGAGGCSLTRDLGVAAALLRMPRSLRAPLVYESHGYAPEVSAALPELVVDGAEA